MSDFVPCDGNSAIRVGAIGHREIAPHLKARVAAAVTQILTDIRTGAEGAPRLVLVSPLAQGADQLIATAALGLGYRLEAVIAIHYGPVHPVHGPILDRPSFAGREIIRTARMEPITPPGEIFVTEQLASALFLAGESGLRCDYVGILSSAKGFGSFRMYSIKPQV